MHRRRWLRVAGAYLLLLAASHVFTPLAKTDAPAPDLRYVELHVVDRGVTGPGVIRLAYRDTAPDSSQIPVILVHGSPGSGEVLRGLADLLPPRFRVIVPDLPGFGASTPSLPDYSFRAHGAYLIQLLDLLHLSRAQLVGFSMGGGVVLSVADLAPERVASLVMLSAVGVQEREISGSYAVNHFLHGVQLGVLWCAREFFPDFGLFSRTRYSVEYARNFYDSDQRPLRQTLERYRGPMLIIHGVRDSRVPIEAAREHHRLVANSVLIEFGDDHFMAFTNPAEYSDQLIAFLSSSQ
jgi:pimeloyl-ACP methyl ester carboxylesterase